MTGKVGFVLRAVAALAMAAAVLGGGVSSAGAAASAPESAPRQDPLTGRGVPISAVITNVPESSPVTIPVNIEEGTASRIDVILGKVTLDGVEVDRSNIVATAGQYRGGSTSCTVRLAVHQKAESGTYRVKFRCINEDFATKMAWHYQDIVHADDANASLHARAVDLPKSGRGVPISAVTVSTPRTSPADVAIELTKGTGTQVRVVLGEVTHDGNLVTPTDVLSQAGTYTEGDGHAYIRLKVKDRAPRGTYVVKFFCVNEDFQSGMDDDWAMQEIFHPGPRREERQEQGVETPLTGRGVPISAWSVEGEPSTTWHGPGRLTVPIFMNVGDLDRFNQYSHTAIERVVRLEDGNEIDVHWTSVLLRAPASVAHWPRRERINIEFEVKNPSRHEVEPGDYVVYFRCFNENGTPPAARFQGGRLQIRIP